MKKIGMKQDVEGYSHHSSHITHHSRGISLISLIITIIVIIILAAIVIFTGINTPYRANFAKFTSECSDLQTSVTQEFYEAVMGENPSQAKGAKLPVESVSWYDCLVVSNKLSMLLGKTPCYKVNGSTNPADWGYTPHQGTIIESEIEFDTKADGFRIPTMEEWDVAIKGGENYMYSGSDDLDSVAWTDCNSGGKLHEVAQLKPNAFGIYDMSGNVFEWVWSVRADSSRYVRGGSFFDAARAGKCTNKELNYASRQMKSFGFRITWNKPEEDIKA